MSHRNHPAKAGRACLFMAALAAVLAAAAPKGAAADASTNKPADKSDMLLDLLVQKGLVSQQDAQSLKAEADSKATNAPPARSVWKINPGIKSIELFGDLRFRYEFRNAESAGAPLAPDGRIGLDRYRYAARFGVRGDLFDDFNYGLRLETAQNPRSPWATFGQSAASSGGVTSYGPSGKSPGAAISVGQAYVGWKPESWGEITVGKMPNPLYTTPMVWDSDINPEGAVEKLKYSSGNFDFFANFGQFLYQDTSPADQSYGLMGTNTTIAAAPGPLTIVKLNQHSSVPFLLAWQLGFTYHVKKDTTFKVAPTIYNYTSHGINSDAAGAASFADTFVGQGNGGGLNFPYPGGVQPGNGSATNSGLFFNQTAINNLLVFDVPFELNFKLGRLNARFFGDFAENLQGQERAAAAAGYLAGAYGAFPVQKNDDKAYQFGFGFGNAPLGLAYGSTSKKGTWEARTYWQHIEQYALDVNLIDSDFFEGRANLEGIFSVLAYSFSDNMIGTVRYGHASRINKTLGTGGSNLDIPQINPIKEYDILQLDLTYRF